MYASDLQQPRVLDKLLAVVELRVAVVARPRSGPESIVLRQAHSGQSMWPCIHEHWQALRSALFVDEVIVLHSNIICQGLHFTRKV